MGTQRIKCMGTGENKRRGAGSGADFKKKKNLRETHHKGWGTGT